MFYHDEISQSGDSALIQLHDVIQSSSLIGCCLMGCAMKKHFCYVTERPQPRAPMKSDALHFIYKEIFARHDRDAGYYG